MTPIVTLIPFRDDDENEIFVNPLLVAGLQKLIDRHERPYDTFTDEEKEAYDNGESPDSIYSNTERTRIILAGNTRYDIPLATDIVRGMLNGAF